MEEHNMEQSESSEHAATQKMQIFSSIEQTSKSFSEGTSYFIMDMPSAAMQSHSYNKSSCATPSRLKNTDRSSACQLSS
jgi:hypothetical protein